MRNVTNVVLLGTMESFTVYNTLLASGFKRK